MKNVMTSGGGGDFFWLGQGTGHTAWATTVCSQATLLVDWKSCVMDFHHYLWAV